MQPQALNDDELSILDDCDEDLVLLEIIKGMSIEELSSFDSYTPLCIKHYNKVQVKWLTAEECLIQGREGHSEFVEQDELLQDMEENHNPQRFRAYYVLKYPAFVEPLSKKVHVNCPC
jgi:hypothetical protein